MKTYELNIDFGTMTLEVNANSLEEAKQIILDDFDSILRHEIEIDTIYSTEEIGG